MKKQLLIGVSAFALVASVSLLVPKVWVTAHAQPLNGGIFLLAQAEGEEEEEIRKKRKKEREAAEEQQAEQPAEAQGEEQSGKKKRRQAEEQQAEQPAEAQQQSGQPAETQGEEQTGRKKKRQQAQEQQADQPAETQQQSEQPAEQPAEAQQQSEQPVEQPAEAQGQDQPAATTTQTDGEGDDQQRRKKKRQQAQEEQAEPPAEAGTVTQQPSSDQPATGDAATGQPPATTEETVEPAAGEENNRRKKRREQAGDPDVLTPEAQQKAVEEAQQPVTVSPEAEKPKDVVTKPVEQVVKEAESQPVSVVSDQINDNQREQMKRSEKRRREKSRENRNELLGAAAVGVAIGAAIPLLGGTVAADEGDRIVVQRGGNYYVRKDESALFRYDAENVEYERMRGGLTREIVTRPNGVTVITVRDAGGYVLRREKVMPGGRRIVLFDMRSEEAYYRPYRPVEVPFYEVDLEPEEYIVSARRADRDLFYETFEAPPVYESEERYTLRDVRENERVRSLVRRVDLDTITFDTGSAFVTESQVALLGDIAGGMLDVIEKDPSAVFLIEGHTDAVGSELSNLTLSDRRAEAVARILTEAYEVPPENMVVQGYGEAYPKVETEGPERANRRVALRNITPILQTAEE